MSQAVPILLNLIAAVLGAFGQYFYKLGGSRLGSLPLYKNWPLFLGVGIFCTVMTLFVTSYRLGGRMSVVYPVYATTFVWGVLLAILKDQEPYSLGQLAGVGLVVIGTVVVAVASPK